VLCDEGVVDAAVLVPAQRRHAVLANVGTHLLLPLYRNPRRETNGIERRRVISGEGIECRRRGKEGEERRDGRTEESKIVLESRDRRGGRIV
jgi:hypothetical protein